MGQTAASPCSEKREQEQRANPKPAVAGLQNALARETVGSVAGDQEQQDAGCKLRQANQAKIERAMGERIDLPAHGHGLHFGRGE